MSKICVLITSEYPYKTQETFIEDEIHFLSQQFDKIYIFSLDVLQDEKKRSIPENVTAIPIGKIKRESKFRYPVYVLNGLLSPAFFKEKAGNLKKYLMKTYIAGKSGSEFAIINKHLKTLLLPDDKVCIYSYWFFNHAMIACRLKNALMKQGYAVNAFSRGHGYDIYSERNSMNYNPFQKPMIRYLDGVFTCSANGRQYLIDKYGKKICQEKVRISRLGTLEHGTSMQKDFSSIHFVTCSHLSELKRVSLFAKAFVLFIEAVREMKKDSICPDGISSLLYGINIENIRWTCMGSGVEYDQIRNTITEAGLQNQVVFTGRIAHDDVMKFYSEHEITFFFNISTTEGVPVSIMEAQSFGIPVIATDVGGTSEIVNSENGRLMNSSLTPEQLCQVIIEECNEESIRRKQKNSRLDWEKNSFADVLYSEWCTFLSNSL